GASPCRVRRGRDRAATDRAGAGHAVAGETPMSVPDPERTLHDRAQQLARVPAAPRSAERVELLEFALDNERYAFRSSQVHDVQPLRELTPLPCTPPFLRGLVNVHGRLVAVI